MRGAFASPNIWRHPALYERLNAAADPDGLVWSALRDVRPWDGADVVDVGCGTGYHLPEFAGTARAVLGVEPNARLVALADRRCAGLPNVTVRRGTAQALPLPDSSVDLLHARWAYFFGPGCEPGLAEAHRVLRRGGVVTVVDVDPTSGSYGRWFRRAYPDRDPERVERFWARLGFATRRLPTRWVFERRVDLESVLRIEFPPGVAETAIQESSGLDITVAQVIRHRSI